MDKKYVVYQHVTPDGMYYFGQTQNVEKRWRKNGSLYKETALQPYIEKFGWDNIKHIVLFKDQTRENALWIENFLIETAREDGVCINQRRSGLVSKEEDYNKNQCKQYYEQNRDEILEQKQDYYQKNKDEILEQQREYYEKNKQQIRKQQKQYYEQNKEQLLKKNKQYYEQNREKLLEQKQDYCQKNKDKIRERQLEYYQKNREKLLEQRHIRYQKKKLEKQLKEVETTLF